MGRLAVDDVKVGLVLSKAVLNAQGGMLINKGTPLAENHIRLLRVWGVKEVFVVSPEDDKNKVNVEKEVQNASKEIDDMFKGTAADPVMTIIKNIAKKQLRGDIEESLEG